MKKYLVYTYKGGSCLIFFSCCCNYYQSNSMFSTLFFHKSYDMNFFLSSFLVQYPYCLGKNRIIKFSKQHSA